MGYHFAVTEDSESGKAPKVVAHRGDASNFPENTLSAFAAAIEAGAQFVELDIQLSRDSKPVVIHDPTLLRTCGLADPVWTRDAAELARIDAGFRYPPHQRSSMTCIPTLSGLARWASDYPQVTWFIEIKEHSIDQFGLETTVGAVIESLGSLRACVISFDAAVVERVRQTSSHPAGWVIRDYDATGHRTAEAMQPDYLFCNYLKLADPWTLWPGTWQWVFYEVTDVQIARRLAAAGAEFVETMAVPKMLKALTLSHG